MCGGEGGVGKTIVQEVSLQLRDAATLLPPSDLLLVHPLADSHGNQRAGEMQKAAKACGPRAV